MRQRNTLLSVMAFSIVLLCAATVAAKQITLTFSNQNPESGWGGQHAIGPWAKELEKATKGAVEVQVFYSETLSKAKDAWSSTKSGIADISWCFHGFYTTMFPLSDVVSLPGLPFKTAEKGSEMFWKLYQKYEGIQKEFADVKLLLLYTSDPYNLITTNKPVKTMEDIKGLKIRMTGGPPTEMLKALGGTPLLISMPDTYLALQKGVIDGMGAPWEAIDGYRLYEVVKNYVQVPFPAVYFSIIMNKKKWESLDKNIQDAIMSVSGLEGSKYWGRNFFDAAKQNVLEKGKVTSGKEINIDKLSDEEWERWSKVGGKPIWDQWVQKMQSQGHANAQQILDSAIEFCK